MKFPKVSQFIKNYVQNKACLKIVAGVTLAVVVGISAISIKNYFKHLLPSKWSVNMTKELGFVMKHGDSEFKMLSDGSIFIEKLEGLKVISSQSDIRKAKLNSEGQLEFYDLNGDLIAVFPESPADTTNIKYMSIDENGLFVHGKKNVYILEF